MTDIESRIKWTIVKYLVGNKQVVANLDLTLSKPLVLENGARVWGVRVEGEGEETIRIER